MRISPSMVIAGARSWLERLLGQSIRRRLILSFSLISLSVVLLAGHMLYAFQRDFLYTHGVEHARGLARTLAFSSTSWVLANDVVGLQETLQGAAGVEDLKFAVVLSPQGEILAATHTQYIGRYFTDAVSRTLQEGEPEPRVLVDSPELLDVAEPIRAGTRHIGWVRVELGRETANANLRNLRMGGVGLTGLLLLLIVYIATLLARNLTGGLDRLIAVANAAEQGRKFERDHGNRADEIGVLAGHFYRMLDAIGCEQQARRQSEERWKFALEGAGDGVWDWNPQTDVAIFSRRWKAMVGYAEDEFPDTGTAWVEHLHPEDRQQVLLAVQDYFSSKRTSYQVEFRMRCKDGSWKWVLARGMLVGRDAAGNPVRMIGTHTDISERKRAEAELREKTQLLDSIVDNIPNMVFLKRATDLRFELFNRAGETLLGYPREALLGKNDYDLFPQQQAAFFTQKDREVLAQREVVDVPEEQIQTRTGPRILHTRKLTLADEQGQAQYLLGISEDITERKQAGEAIRKSEAQMKEAQRMAMIGSWELDLLTGGLYWSDEVFHIFEIDRVRFGASYEAFLNAIHPEDRGRVNQAYAQSLQTRQPYSIDHRLQMADGRIKHVHEQCETEFSSEGKPLRSMGTVQDITARVVAEEELRRYKDHLEDEVQQRTADLVLARNAAETANRAKSVFLASMSHELRTPLNAILGFSNMMREDAGLSGSQRNHLDIINRSGEHLLHLINDVLEMAKIEAGRVQVESAPFDLGNLVRDVTDMMHVRAQEKGLQLLIDQSSEFPRYIRGDEARLRQVLINLVGNAVKFTDQGGVTVRLGVTSQHRLLIEVEDSGVGIRPEDQRRIFEPFVQLGESAVQKGTGLGLTITRQFIELMGGSISLESMPGQGSVFRVEMPVDSVDESEVGALRAEMQGEVIGLAPGQPEIRVLIVEDQMENQMLLSGLMQRVGILFRVAENGVQALEMFQSWQPHLIWMDRRMPVMDGMEATRRIRQLPGGDRVKIVAVTASAFLEQREEMLQVGMDGFVRKPYRFGEIYDCLAQQLGVRFTHADGGVSGLIPVDEELSDGMFARLPAAWCEQLRAALESLESERIAEVLARVSAQDAKLGKILGHFVDNFNYPAILAKLPAGEIKREHE